MQEQPGHDDPRLGRLRQPITSYWQLLPVIVGFIALSFGALYITTRLLGLRWSWSDALALSVVTQCIGGATQANKIRKRRASL